MSSKTLKHLPSYKKLLLARNFTLINLTHTHTKQIRLSSQRTFAHQLYSRFHWHVHIMIPFQWKYIFTPNSLSLSLLKKYLFFVYCRCGKFSAWQFPCFPILFDTKSTKCSPFGRSDAVCSNKAYIEPRQQINELSAFIDASQVYSNELELFEELRSKIGNVHQFLKSFAIVNLQKLKQILIQFFTIRNRLITPEAPNSL